MRRMEGRVIHISVKFWGTRGSIPVSFSDAQLDDSIAAALAAAGPGDVGSEAAARAFLSRRDRAWPRRIGGDTTCVEFTNAGGGRVLVDLGSGARRLGAEMMASGGPARPINVLMTHMHWDHLQGFPFFVPAFIPGTRMRIAGGHGPEALKAAILDQFMSPYFPVPSDVIQADLEFFEIPVDRAFELEGFTVTPFLLNHGGGCYGYRFDYEGASVVFASDAQHEPENIRADYPYVQWAKGADALIFDAQYSFVELVLHKGDWGHSSGLVGVDLAHLAEVDRILLTHHDPASTDQMIDDLVTQTREYEEMLREGGARPVAIDAVYDGMIHEV